MNKLVFLSNYYLNSGYSNIEYVCTFSGANNREFRHLIYTLAELKFILKLEMFLSVLRKCLGASDVSVSV